MVNKNLSYKIGRAIGMYYKGLNEVFSTSGSRPSIDDPSIWNLSQFYGEAYGQGKPKTKEDFIKAGMIPVGMNPETDLVEIVEIPKHKWFVGVQFHPEYRSTVLNPHPLFVDFIKNSLVEEK